MKRTLIVVAALALSGCTYIAAHQSGVALFALGAGAVASGENAITNAWTLFDKAKAETREQQK